MDFVRSVSKKRAQSVTSLLFALPFLLMSSNVFAQMGGMGGMGGGQAPQPMPETDEIPPAPSLEEQYEKSSIVKTDYDLHLFHYIPRGAILVRQPEHRRVLFQDKDHHSLGYAQQKGAAIIYYDPQGKPVNVQRLTPEEMEGIF